MGTTDSIPVVSQAKSIYWDTAVETVNGVLDSTPVVGHIKGAVHYACNDQEAGDKAMKSASRTVAVAGSGAVGFMTGGPVGAVAGGIYGGVVMDTVTTAAETAIKGK